MSATIRQERPSATAIIANRGLDAVVVFLGILVVALPFFAMVREIGIAFVILGFVGALLILVHMLVDLLEREYSLYTLESNRLIVDRGIISHQRIVVPLDPLHVQHVAASQPYLGRLVGYGHVVVMTAGFGIIRLRYVSNPYSWQEDILKQVGTFSGAPAPASHTNASGTQPSTQIITAGLQRSILAVSGLVTLLCVCALLFSAGSMAVIKPTPTPVPSPGVIMFPSITGGDILGSLWWLYQIPLIFWSVNAIVLANIVFFVLEAIGKRRR